MSTRHFRRPDELLPRTHGLWASTSPLHRLTSAPLSSRLPEDAGGETRDETGGPSLRDPVTETPVHTEVGYLPTRHSGFTRPRALDDPGVCRILFLGVGVRDVWS